MKASAWGAFDFEHVILVWRRGTRYASKGMPCYAGCFAFGLL